MLRSLPEYTVNDIFTQIANGTACRVDAACFSCGGNRFSFYMLWGSVIRIETHTEDLSFESVLMVEGEAKDIFKSTYL